jgi:hypothetical protein
MSTITISGASDGTIVVELNGKAVEEFTHVDDEQGDLVTVSDGTVIRVHFDSDGTGNWRITPVRRGSAPMAIEQTIGDDGTGRAIIEGPIVWVAHGNAIYTVPDAVAPEVIGPDTLSISRKVLPDAWADLLEALIMLAPCYSDDTSPFNCTNDELAVNAEPSRFTDADLDRLEVLGFLAGMPGTESEGTFRSARFGSA